MYVLNVGFRDFVISFANSVAAAVCFCFVGAIVKKFPMLSLVVLALVLVSTHAQGSCSARAFTCCLFCVFKKKNKKKIKDFFNCVS
jgi:hypothetical protein